MEDEQEALRKSLEANADVASSEPEEVMRAEEPENKTMIRITLDAQFGEEVKSQLEDYFKDFYPLDWVKIEIVP